jgi:hypothetical protein
MLSTEAVIMTVADRRYLAWLEILLRSIKFFHPDKRVMIIGVNLSDAEINSIYDWNPLAEVRKVCIECQRNRFAATVANRRPYWMRDLMIATSSSVLLMDADLLVRGALAFFKEITENQIGIIFRSGLEGGRVRTCLRTAAGLLFVGRGCQAFLDDWISIMESHDRVENVKRNEWFWEQTCLYLASMKYPKQCAAIPSELYLSGHPFQKSAVIWSAHITDPGKHSLLQLFRKELARILAQP